MTAAAIGADPADYAIKPEQLVPTLDAKDWPLLLKNYDKRMILHENRLAAIFKLMNRQSLFELAILHPFLAAAHRSSAISNPTSALVSSISTNPPTLQATK